MTRRLPSICGWLAVFVALVTIMIACGSETAAPDENVGTGDDGGNGLLGNGQKTLTSLTIDPPSATLLVESGGAAQTQQYKATLHYADNST